jgi:hypothetical protein
VAWISSLGSIVVAWISSLGSSVGWISGSGSGVSTSEAVGTCIIKSQVERTGEQHSQIKRDAVMSNLPRAQAKLSPDFDGLQSLLGRFDFVLGEWTLVVHSLLKQSSVRVHNAQSLGHQRLQQDRTSVGKPSNVCRQRGYERRGCSREVTFSMPSLSPSFANSFEFCTNF